MNEEFTALSSSRHFVLARQTDAMAMMRMQTTPARPISFIVWRVLCRVVSPCELFHTREASVSFE